MKMFRKQVAESLGLATGLTDSDLSTLLVYLSRDKKQIAYNDQVSHPCPRSARLSSK